jgi:5-oxopent-3-ene-1,2,5-tricarboxylate decarboxylase/2-hydroxyhepta-2,4-diene-1,7-dioate isomerase
LPPAPTYFHKPITTLNAHGGAVVRPSNCHYLNFEGEIAIVIGTTARNLSYADAGHYIAGYTIANDFGLHDFRDTDAGSMLRVKGQDGFCPIGPGVVSGVDIRHSTLRTYVNSRKVQEGAVSEMVWGIDELLADITRHITLRPDDVVLTGTPWHSRPVFPGDTVEVEVDGVGRLLNTVVEAPAPENRRGYPATVTKTSLGVALGSDYHVLKQHQQLPSAEQYREARADLIARNMASGPTPRSPR